MLKSLFLFVLFTMFPETRSGLSMSDYADISLRFIILSTDLYPVSEPVALRVCAFHSEEHVSTWNHTSLRHSLDLDGKMAVILLKSKPEEHSSYINMISK